MKRKGELFLHCTDDSDGIVWACASMEQAKIIVIRECLHAIFVIATRSSRVPLCSRIKKILDQLEKSGVGCMVELGGRSWWVDDDDGVQPPPDQRADVSSCPGYDTIQGLTKHEAMARLDCFEGLAAQFPDLMSFDRKRAAEVLDESMRIAARIRR